MARADFSGFAIAHDLGAISPTTKCRKVTTNRAIAKPALPAIQSASPHELSMGPSQKSVAGFVTAPSAKVQKVMPNWEPASIRVNHSCRVELPEPTGWLPPIPQAGGGGRPAKQIRL